MRYPLVFCVGHPYFSGRCSRSLLISAAVDPNFEAEGEGVVILALFEECVFLAEH